LTAVQRSRLAGACDSGFPVRSLAWFPTRCPAALAMRVDARFGEQNVNSSLSG
jgi:hypothetical protein